ncbi:MAG: DNA polymerase III subunit beta [Deltaproteobacteria bacterium]
MAVADLDLTPVVQTLRCNVPVRDLRDAARVASFVAPSKSASPALQHVKLSADAGEIVLEASSLDADARLRVRANFTLDGSALVDAKRFAAALARAKGDAQIEMTGTALVVTTDAGRHALPTWPLADFPQLPEPITRPIATISSADLARMVRAVAYAQSQDVTREHLCGALLERADGVLRMVATDGHRMVVARVTCPGPDFSVIVHRAAIDTLARVGIDDEPEVMIRLSPDRVHFCAPFVEVTGKRVPAAFPAFHQVIPSASCGSITFERKAILGALRAVATSPRAGVRLDIDNTRGVVRLTTDDGDGHEATADVEVSIIGEPPEHVGFAQRYLRELLDAIDGEYVTLQLNDNLDPLKVEAADGTIAVLMPMRI